MMRASVPSMAPCAPSFDDHAGWLGGDAAWSIPLGDGPSESIWLFGDSFVAGAEGEAERRYPFVHNTVGLARCNAAGEASIEFFWNRGEPDGPRAFFQPQVNEASTAYVSSSDAHSNAPREAADPFYYWPFGGFVHDDRLFVALLRVAHAPPRGPFALPFRLVGVDLARITPFVARPDRWQIDITRLVGPSTLIPAAAFAVHEGFVHIFAFFDEEAGNHPRALVRLPLDALDNWPRDLSDALETLDRDGEWQVGFKPAPAAVLIPDDATEMSVHWDAHRSTWLAVESGATRAGEPDSGVVRLRRAQRLEGPWSAAETLFIIPEIRAPDAEPDLFCYAAKAHPQYASPSTLLLTYVCSLYAEGPEQVGETLERLTKRTDLYRPIAVRVPIPSTSSP